MNGDQLQLLVLKGVVSEMSPEAQAKVADAKARIVAIVKDFGEEGGIALALVGMEMAAAEGEKS